MRALALAAVVALAASGCGGATACNGSCPVVTDDFSVQTSTLDQSCGYMPWIVPPTLSLGQTSDGNRVTLSVIDPANQVSVPFVADLAVPNNGKAVATFSGLQRTLRQSAFGSNDLLTLEIVVDGVITIDHGRHWLTLTLQTWPLYGSACTSTQIITAVGSLVPPS